LQAGRGAASVVYEDEAIFAFMDIQPVNPGHVLVIPRRHATNLAELDPADAAKLLPVAQKVAAALRASGLRCEGVNLFLADGEAAGQEVFHVHVHVFPRWEGDGFGLRFGPHYRVLPPRGELDDIAKRLGRAMA
jgi:diadenosine tetraphosphate (Ap4A) HIT family hydrolase